MEKELGVLVSEMSASNTRVLKDYGNKLCKEHQEVSAELLSNVLIKLDKLDVLDDLKIYTQSDLSGSQESDSSSLPSSSSALPSSIKNSEKLIGDNQITTEKVYEVIKQYEPVDSVIIKEFFNESSLRLVERLIRVTLKDRVFYCEKHKGYKIKRGAL